MYERNGVLKPNYLSKVIISINFLVLGDIPVTKSTVKKKTYSKHLSAVNAHMHVLRPCSRPINTMKS